ncbi:hypothetical protein [Neisseria yangbaofengii]|uniref:hypothetical protein n=1 Tax=Neisseria yangbaofengii TaxID=2709396 RepID=UPI0013EAFBBC|nr:hypothetical protein [Neisseria yangbaofengii]
MIKKTPILILASLLISCYYDRETGCVQHLNYVDCPIISANSLFKENIDKQQLYIDIKECTKVIGNNIKATKEARYQCMESKGYKRILK